MRLFNPSIYVHFNFLIVALYQLRPAIEKKQTHVCLLNVMSQTIGLKTDKHKKLT